MIKTLNIRNFQSHKNSDLDFSPKINVITGLNDQGKSSIIRALRWIIMNRPLGDSIIRDGEKEVSVSCIFDDDISITRGKTSTKNFYLIKKGKNEEILESFGTDPPKQVLELLKLSEINIQTQFESPLSLRPSNQIAAIIREYAGLDIIDNALFIAVSTTRTLGDKIKILNQRLEKITEEYEKLNSLDLNLFEKYLNKLQEFLKEKENKEETKKKIENILNKYLEVINRYKKIPDVQRAIKEGNEIIELYKEVIVIRNTILEIIIQLSKVSVASKILEDINILLQKGQENLEKFKKINEKQKFLQTILQNLKYIINEEDKIKKKEEDLIEQIDQFIKQIRICPTCGQKFDLNCVLSFHMNK